MSVAFAFASLLLRVTANLTEIDSQLKLSDEIL